MKIIYLPKSGIVEILTRVLTEINPETGNFFTIDEIAKKDIPTGFKYKKIEDSDVPSDRTVRDAWTVDEAALTDGVGE